jgi:hypothetical protein
MGLRTNVFEQNYFEHAVPSVKLPLCWNWIQTALSQHSQHCHLPNKICYIKRPSANVAICGFTFCETNPFLCFADFQIWGPDLFLWAQKFRKYAT